MIFKQIYLTHRWDINSTTTPSQSEPGSNGNERVHYTPQISYTEALSSDAI